MNTTLQTAIENFENTPGLNYISPERKTFLDQVYVNKDSEELVAVRTIGRQDMEGAILAGVDNDGVYAAILLSFVKKKGVCALQVISMSERFKPNEQLAFGITLSNDEKMLFHFAHKMAPVEGTDYFANFIQLTDKNIADFILHNIVHWQFLNKQTNDILTSDFQAQADAILPEKEAQYLLRKIACEIAKFGTE